MRRSSRFVWVVHVYNFMFVSIVQILQSEVIIAKI